MKYLKYITLVALLAFAVSCSKDDDGAVSYTHLTLPTKLGV